MAFKEYDDDYTFSRSYKDSVRLVLQHRLWLYNIKKSSYSTKNRLFQTVGGERTKIIAHYE